MNSDEIIQTFFDVLNEHSIKNGINLYHDFDKKDNIIEIFCAINSSKAFEIKKILTIYTKNQYVIIEPWMQIIVFGKILNKNGLKITNIKNKSGYNSLFNYMFRGFYYEDKGN